MIRYGRKCIPVSLNQTYETKSTGMLSEMLPRSNIGYPGTTGYSWTLGVGGGGGGGVWVQKNRDRILRRNKKNRIRPRSGRKFGVFEVQNAIWEALGSVKASGKGKIFAPPARAAIRCFSVL